MIARFAVIVAFSAMSTLAMAQDAPEAPMYKADDIEAFFAPGMACPEGEACIPRSQTRSVCIGTTSDCASEAEVAQAEADPGAFDLLITFDFASDRLTPQARQNLTEFAKAMKSDTLADAKFNIDGYTDASGPTNYNMALSDRRAEAVVSYLESLGVSRSRLVAEGHGETNPRVADPFAAVNRRVEATLHIQ